MSNLTCLNCNYTTNEDHQALSKCFGSLGRVRQCSRKADCQWSPCSHQVPFGQEEPQEESSKGRACASCKPPCKPSCVSLLNKLKFLQVCTHFNEQSVCCKLYSDRKWSSVRRPSASASVRCRHPSSCNGDTEKCPLYSILSLRALFWQRTSLIPVESSNPETDL